VIASNQELSIFDGEGNRIAGGNFFEQNLDD